MFIRQVGVLRKTGFKVRNFAVFTIVKMNFTSISDK